jgi:hypothetical protein
MFSVGYIVDKCSHNSTSRLPAIVGLSCLGRSKTRNGREPCRHMSQERCIGPPEEPLPVVDLQWSTESHPMVQGS